MTLLKAPTQRPNDNPELLVRSQTCCLKGGEPERQAGEWVVSDARSMTEDPNGPPIAALDRNNYILIKNRAKDRCVVRGMNAGRAALGVLLTER